MEAFAIIILSSSVEQGMNQNKDPQIKVVNPILMINPEIFPTLFSLTVTIMTTGINITSKDILELVVTDPDKDVIFTTGSINAPDMPTNTNIMLNMDLKNVKIQKEGKFQVDFNINGLLAANAVFFVQDFSKEQ